MKCGGQTLLTTRRSSGTEAVCNARRGLSNRGSSEGFLLVGPRGMQEPTPRSRAWLTRQALRTWYVGCDAARLVSGLGGVVRSSFGPRPRAAGLAALAGEAVACIGSPSRYRVRVSNPTATARVLRVVVTAWQDDASAPSFELTWDVTLAPGDRGALVRDHVAPERRSLRRCLRLQRAAA